MTLIDKFILQAKSVESDKKGGNKKCWLFPAHALLAGSCKQDEIEKTMNRQQQLAKDGVNLLPIIDYKIISDKNDLGFQKAYILQRKAKGKELHSESLCVEEYEQNISNLATEKQEFYDKFVEDWIKIDDAGLGIDPSKSANFFHEEGKQINFIDLNIKTHERDKDVRFFESSVVLLGGGKYWQFCGEVNSSCQKKAAVILGKLKSSFIKNGYNERELNNVIEERFYNTIPNYKAKEDTDNIINNCKKNRHGGW